MTEPKPAPKARKKQDYSSAEYAAQDRDIVEQLNAMPKVWVRAYQVPADSSDEKLPDLTVSINGYVYQIQRGVTVEVPEEVANILAEAGHI